MKQAFSLIALVAAMPAFAQETRQLDAHEHGVGTLNIAIDGTMVDMTFEAPGADIVGFEYAAKSDTNHAKIDAAIATLSAPLDLFMLPDAAGCTVITAETDLKGGNAPVDHDDEHDHEDHAEEAHDEHDHEGHAEAEHDEHDHEDHAEAASHTEFQANYELSCDAPDALNQMTFAYFDVFPNAQEVEVQIITSSGAQAFEVERDAPVLDLER